MPDLLLALNAGSSSLKFQVSAPGSVGTAVLKGAVDRIGSSGGRMTLTDGSGTKTGTDSDFADHDAAIAAVCAAIREHCPDDRVTGVGHRIVHGGGRFTEAVKTSPEIISELEALIRLAPLHQPHGIAGIRAAQRHFPGAVNVACFDTAFHAVKPRVHNAFGLPRGLYDEGLRRYGFHGLSCQSVMRTLKAEGHPVDESRIVIAHLGNGCSVTAVRDGSCVSNSMGFSTLDGLLMGTRCGRIDPGVLLHLMRDGHSADDLERLLYKESGLLGVSGISNDMRDLTRSDKPEAREAVDCFVGMAVGEICRMAGALGGLDTVVFCGGIGENAEDIRAAIRDGLDFLPGRTGNGVEFLVRETKEEEEILLSVKGLVRPDA